MTSAPNKPELVQPEVGKGKFTKLHDCSYTRDLGGIKYYLKQGEDPNAQDSKGWTPLMWLMELPVSYKNLKRTKRMYRVLINSGAKPFYEASPGWSPEFLANRSSYLFGSWVSRDLARRIP